MPKEDLTTQEEIERLEDEGGPCIDRDDEAYTLVDSTPDLAEDDAQPLQALEPAAHPTIPDHRRTDHAHTGNC